MTYILTFLYTFAVLYFCYWINKKYIKTTKPYVLPILFLFKLGYAVFFLYVYTYHYGGGELTLDAGIFFKESKILNSVFYESPKDYLQFLFGTNNDVDFINSYLEDTRHWNAGQRYLFNDSRNVIRINSLLLFITNGQVFIHFILFSFASFFGGIELFHWLKKKTKLPHPLLLAILTLAPSIAFWSASIIKEPLMILGLALFLRGCFDQISKKSRAWRIVLGFVLMFGFKSYVALLFLPVFIYYLFFSKWFKKQWLALTLMAGLGIGAMVVTGYADKAAYVIANQQEDFYNVANGGLYLHGDEEHYYYIPYYSRQHFLLEKRQATLIKPVSAFYLKRNENYERFPFLMEDVGTTYKIYLNMEAAGSIIYITPIRDNFWRMLLIGPQAIANSFFQPIPNKNSSWLQYPALIETIMFIIAAILSLLLFPKKVGERDKRIIIALTIYAVITGMIVGWTTPVSGAIVRYFIPAQLVILVIFILKFDYPRFQQKWLSRK